MKHSNQYIRDAFIMFYHILVNDIFAIDKVNMRMRELPIVILYVKMLSFLVQSFLYQILFMHIAIL